MNPVHVVELPGVEISPAKRALLEARLRGRGAAGTIPRRDREGDIPLSFSQERFWFLDQLGQGGAAYTLAPSLRLAGAVDAAVLERALDEVVRRHESLRTTFRAVDGVPRQVIAPPGPFALAVEDLSALPPAEREAEVSRRAAAAAAHVFNLTEGPLFRASLLRLGENEHLLQLCMHHIVTDGWSTGVLFRELWALYDAFREGRPSPLPELPLQYADYAAWQRAQAEGEAQARQLAWWRERMAGAPEVLELPADHPRPALPSLRGATVPVHVPAELVERLRNLGRAEGATLYMVILAAFKALLARYSGSDDVVVGTPVAGRTHGELEGLVGLFMNTLALRTDLSGDPSFRALLGRVREGVLGAYEHQELPFSRLVAELQPGRSLSHSTVFQVLFQLDTLDASAGRGAGSRARHGGAADRGTARLDLSLDLDATARGLDGVLEYSTDLFERGTVHRMSAHLECILEQAAAHPDRRLSRLELMTRVDRARVLEWNRTTARYPAESCIHRLFEEQAARTPDAPAVVFGTMTLTYRELDARANRLANHLVRRGVGPEVRVGLFLERGPELMVALMGVLKAGGAYVPLDAAYPEERLAYMLADAGVRVLLTHERLRPRAPAAAETVSVDGAWAEIEAEPADPPETGVVSENLCYVIYTSGSTGRPKGVAMHHRGVANYIHWGVRAYGAQRGHGAPVFSSMAVDLTITNLLPLFAGLSVRLLPEENPVEALAAVLRERPGFGLIKITPVHLSLLTPLLTPDEARAAAHTLVIGADFLSAEPTVFWQDQAPGTRLMNEYGPTETVVGCSAYVLPPGKHRAGPVPVGHPIQNLRFYVLDAHLEPLPVGVPGELYIAGAGVARGYLGRPGLTAEKFVPDPFADAGERMYRTGDRARWLVDGNLMILGRTDQQVKVRGYRVELGEVEAVLRRHPGVSACVAVVREDPPGDRRLVAYVVGDAGPEALRDHLRRSVPEYMVPAAFVALDALPQTSTGKLDPRALPAPEYVSAGGECAGPASETEARLVRIWEELLGVGGIGTTASFFELGGNSFLALRLLAQVNRQLGCSLSVSVLFAGPTVRQMAAAVEGARPSHPAADAPIVALRAEGSLAPLFCIHPSDRRVFGYVTLVSHLGADQPVFGIQDLGEDLARPVARIAAEHVRALRAFRPEGPYHLLGWSFGGLLAYEMASLLEREGQPVGLVGIVDTLAPYLAQQRRAYDEVELLLGAAGDVAERAGIAFALPRESLDGLEPDERLHRVAQALHARGVSSAFDAGALREHVRALGDRITSVSGYAPGPFSGRLTLFRSGVVTPEYTRFFAPFTDEEEATLGWCRISPHPVEVHVLSGSHNLLGTEPHVRVFARRVREALAAARACAAEALP